MVEIYGTPRKFTFLLSNVSISCSFIHRRRCSFGNRCICTALIFASADTLFQANVSTTCFSLNLQMLFNWSVMYNCICILPFLGLEDISHRNFSSTSHVFYDMRMLLIEIMHPQLALSITCRYSPAKLCIRNSRKSIVADTPTKIASTTPPQQSSALSFIKHAIAYCKKTSDMYFPLTESDKNSYLMFLIRPYRYLTP